MHGVSSSSSYTVDTELDKRRPLERLGDAVRRWRKLLLLVGLPTALLAFYLFAIASDQYESEAHFIVRASSESPSVGSGLGQILSLTGGLSPAQAESMSVSDYLSSHDAVGALRASVALVERFRRPEADPLSRLASDQPTAEALLRYYRRHVDVAFDSQTGITTLRVRTFRPEDSLVIITRLLALGEKRVNALNRRAYDDMLAVSRRQLVEAEEAVAKAQARMTRFRQGRRNFDPPASGEAQIRLVSNLTASLAAARAQLASMAGAVAPSSPQYVAMAARVRALEAQVGAQSGRLAGNGRTMASDLGAYEELRLRQDFAAKRYAASAAAVEKAREQAQKQQLFVVRVVEPNLAQKPLYPKRWTILATVFCGLLLLYGIGWLIAAGVKEHAA